jgi:prepilin-type N-terminal cleavage/methylation domain-containing protein
MSKNSRPRGFTLPEVLVTVTIVAVLAAVVVPAVLNQVSKGDDSAVGADLTGLRTAITAFTSDVRKYPGDLRHLGGTALSNAALDFDSTAYGTTASNSYRGPYFQVEATGTHTGPTGAIFGTRLTKSSNRVCLQDSVNVANKSLVSVTQASQMDKALDGNDGATAGVVRWTPTGTTPDSVTPKSFTACLVTK